MDRVVIFHTIDHLTYNAGDEHENIYVTKTIHINRYSSLFSYKPGDELIIPYLVQYRSSISLFSQHRPTFTVEYIDLRDYLESMFLIPLNVFFHPYFQIAVKTITINISKHTGEEIRAIPFILVQRINCNKI
jgi:hypothetical protein